MLQKIAIALRAVSLAFAICGLALAKAGSATIQQMQKTMPSGQAGNQAYLIKEARHELTMLPGYSLFDWLEYEVLPDGSVILRGQVRGPTLKADAENSVKRIEGVTEVINQIENLPILPSDDQMRRALFRAIYRDDSPLFHYALQAVPSIHIIIKNGNVTLKGVVDNQSDRDLANINARGVPGIFAVKNELSVEKR